MWQWWLRYGLVQVKNQGTQRTISSWPQIQTRPHLKKETVKTAYFQWTIHLPIPISQVFFVSHPCLFPSASDWKFQCSTAWGVRRITARLARRFPAPLAIDLHSPTMDVPCQIMCLHHPWAMVILTWKTANKFTHWPIGRKWRIKRQTNLHIHMAKHGM
jgi:hypothetical protein